MPGIDLNLQLPSIGDSFASILAAWNTALSAIEDDLAAKVVPSEINVNASFSLNGNYLTNVGAVQLLSGNTPASAGSFYYKAGEFYVRNSTGELKLTDGTALNAAAIGSIVGDYGGANPARVSYNDASGEFRFTEDTGTKADLDCDDLILNSAAGSVRLGVHNDIATARQVVFRSLPSSGTSLLVYNAADSTVLDHTTAVSNAPTFSTAVKETFERSRRVALKGGNGATEGSGVVVTTAAPATWGKTLEMEKGDRLKTIKVTWFKTTVATASMAVHRVDHSGSISAAVESFASAGVIGATTSTFTIAAPTALLADEDYYLNIGLPANGDSIRGVTISTDRPNP